MDIEKERKPDADIDFYCEEGRKLLVQKRTKEN